MFRAIFRNQRGNSMLLMLAMLALITSLGVGTLTMITDSFRSANFFQAKTNQLGVMQVLQTHLTKKTSCEENFSTLVLDSEGRIAVPEIKDGSQNKVLAVGDLVGDDSLRVVEIKLDTPSPIWSAFQAAQASLPPEGYLLDSNVAVTFEKVKTSFGSKTFTSSFKTSIRVDSSRQVTACAGPVTPDVSGICQQLGGVFNTSKNICEFSQDCLEESGQKLVSGVCVDTRLAQVNESLKKANDTLAAAFPSPTPTPQPSPASAEEQSAWSAVSGTIKTCLNSPVSMDAVEGLITCSRGQGAVSLNITPNDIRIKINTQHLSYSGAQAKYIYERTQEVLNELVSK